ncbi:MAG: type II secretion system protein [Methylococcales bacterium]
MSSFNNAVTALAYPQQGFSYVEVLIATILISVSLIPALDSLSSGLGSANTHQTLTRQYYVSLSKMEQIKAETFINLLDAAKTAGDQLTASSYSDTAKRCFVYLSLYDADSDPFTVADPNTDNDNDPYTGSSANLLWVRVTIEGSPQTLETLLRR